MSDKTAVTKVKNEDIYERIMSENEFRIRQYPENTMSSRLKPTRVLRMLQFCYEQELAMVDLDLTQCFKTGWLQPGHRLIKAFGYNPAGERSEELQKLVALLSWIRENVKGVGITWAKIDVEKTLGTFGAEGPRAELLKWLKENHGSKKVSEGNLEALVKEQMGLKEERQLSPMWMEVALLLPNKDDPKEVHDCESQGVEDPKIVIRAGFKQNDMGYFVLMPKLAAFHRTIGGVFTEIEQKSYYPYYPFTAAEQAILLAGINTLLAGEDLKALQGVTKPGVTVDVGDRTVALDPAATPDFSKITLDDVKTLKKVIEGIRDERGPQTPDGEKEDVT